MAKKHGGDEPPDFPYLDGTPDGDPAAEPFYTSADDLDFEEQRFAEDGVGDGEPPRGSPEWVAKIMEGLPGETLEAKTTRWLNDGKTADEEEAIRLHNQWQGESRNEHQRRSNGRARELNLEFSVVGGSPAGADLPLMVHFTEELLARAKAISGSQDHPWAEGFLRFHHLAVLGEFEFGLTDRAEHLRLYRATFEGKRVYVADPGQLDFALELTRIAEKEGWDFKAVYLSQLPDLFPEGWSLNDEVPFDPKEDAPFRFQRYIDLYRVSCLMVLSTGMGRSLKHVPTRHGLRSFVVVPSMSVFGEYHRPWKVLPIARAHWVYNRLTRHVDGSRTTIDPVLDDERTMKVETLTYIPNGGVVVESRGFLALNQWRPTNIQPKQGSIRHFERIFRFWGLSAFETKALMYWLACVIRGRRPMWGVLITSNLHGLGKNTLAEFIAKLVGRDNAIFLSSSDLEDERKQWAAFKTLVVVSEIYEGRSWKMFNYLKNFVGSDGETSLQVNPKGIGAYSIENTLNMMTFSNAEDEALRLGHSDRRWFVLSLAPGRGRVPPTRYFTLLRRWFNHEGGAEAVLHWALNVDLVELGRHVEIEDGREVVRHILAEGHAPMTESKEMLIEANRPFWVDQLDLGPGATVRTTDGRVVEIEYVVVADVKERVRQLVEEKKAEGKKVEFHADEVMSELAGLGFRKAHRSRQLKIGKNREMAAVYGRHGGDLTPAAFRAALAIGEVKMFTEDWRTKVDRSVI